MGAWGPGIFSNDTAADARDSWRKALIAGEDPAGASARIVEQLSGGFDDTDLWTGLAAAQYETGHLQEDVRERALAVIDAGGDLELWEESGDRRTRERVLTRLAAKLRGPQPAPKRLRGPRPAPDPGIVTGDVLRIWSPDRKRSALFHVAGRQQDSPVLVGLFDEDGTEPVLERIPEWKPASEPLVVVVSVQRAGDEWSPEIGEVCARGVDLAFEPDLSDENWMTDNAVSLGYLAELISMGEHDARRTRPLPEDMAHATPALRRFWMEHLRRTLDEASAGSEELTESEAEALAQLRAAAEAMFADLDE